MEQIQQQALDAQIPLEAFGLPAQVEEESYQLEAPYDRDAPTSRDRSPLQWISAADQAAQTMSAEEILEHEG